MKILFFVATFIELRGVPGTWIVLSLSPSLEHLNSILLHECPMVQLAPG